MDKLRKTVKAYKLFNARKEETAQHIISDFLQNSDLDPVEVGTAVYASMLNDYQELTRMNAMGCWEREVYELAMQAIALLIIKEAFKN